MLSDKQTGLVPAGPRFRQNSLQFGQAYYLRTWLSPGEAKADFRCAAEKTVRHSRAGSVRNHAQRMAQQAFLGDDDRPFPVLQRARHQLPRPPSDPAGASARADAFPPSSFATRAIAHVKAAALSVAVSGTYERPPERGPLESDLLATRYASRLAQLYPAQSPLPLSADLRGVPPGAAGSANRVHLEPHATQSGALREWQTTTGLSDTWCGSPSTPTLYGRSL